MPKTIIKYNVSPDCVVIHHGVRPRRRAERIEIMKPLVDEVVATLSTMYPATTFESKPSESDRDFYGPGMLLHVTSADAINPNEQRDVLEVTNGVNTDLSRIIEAYPEEFEWLDADDIDTLRRLSRLQFHDPATLMTVLDGSLGLLEQLTDLRGVDFLTSMCQLTMPKRFEMVSLGSVHPVLSPDESSLVGFRIRLAVPSSATTLAHEAAHVLELRYGNWESNRHGERYVSYLKQVLRVAVDTDWEARVRSLCHEAPPGVSAPATARSNTFGCMCPERIEDARWRMSSHDGSGWYAIWCSGGVSSWGIGSADNKHFLSELEEDERAFAGLLAGPSRPLLSP